jgi:hypothetical protein
MASAEAFRWLPPGEAINSIGAAYDRLMTDRPGCLAGFVSNAGFWDIGTVADYINTSRALSAPGAESARRAVPIPTVHADPTADFATSILWDHITIERDVRLEECIVTDRVVVPAGAVYRRSILIETPIGLRAIPLGSAVNENRTVGA